MEVGYINLYNMFHLNKGEKYESHQ